VLNRPFVGNPTLSNDDGSRHHMYVAYSRYGRDAQEVLQLCEHSSLPSPNSRNGEVLIRIHASTVSPSDCAIRRGEFQGVSLNPYIIPGVGILGTIYTPTDKDSNRRLSSFSYSSPVQPGDTVLSLGISGGNSRFTCLPKTHLVKVPPQLDPSQTVCLAETYLTGFQVLHTGQKGGMRYRGNSLAGQSILILGGYSALGKALIELCLAGGAKHCYALASQPEGAKGNSSSRRHFETLEAWGAVALSSDPQDWLTLIGRQIDLMVVVYDPSNRAYHNEHISDDHCKALREDGQVVVVCTHPGLDNNESRSEVFGSTSINNQRDSNNPFRIPSRLLSNRDSLADRTIWYNVFDSWEKKSHIARKDLEHLLRLLELNRIHPEVLECIPLSKVAKAQFVLDNRRLVGHLVCAPWMKQTTNPVVSCHGVRKERCEL